MNEKKTTGVAQQRFCLLLLSYTECEKVYLTFKTKYKKQQKNDWDNRLPKITKINKLELCIKIYILKNPYQKYNIYDQERTGHRQREQQKNRDRLEEIAIHLIGVPK